MSRSAVSRIAFAFDDLEDEIRAVCGGISVEITITLPSPSYDQVAAALANHAGVAASPGDVMQHNGITIFRGPAP